MSKINIKEMQQKIEAGMLLAQKRMMERKKKENGELVIFRDGKVMKVKAREFNINLQIDKKQNSLWNSKRDF